MLRLLEKPLRAGLLGLRLLDELNHARERGILRALADGKFQAAALIERAGKNRIADGLGDRHRLASETGFIDMARALHHGSIHRHMLARPQHHYIADIQFLDANHLRAAIALHQRLVRPQLQQRVDGPLRALQRVALQDIRKRKKKQQQRALEGLPDNPSTDRSQNHQHIDIKHAAPQRGDRRAHPLLTAENISSRIERQGRNRAAPEGFLANKGGDQKNKTQRGGNLLIQ